jgi:DNA-binding HxlR family transcriptional regulator
MSSALLVRRLKEFQFAGIVERRRNLAAVFEYHLTSAGRELFPVVEKMGPGAQLLAPSRFGRQASSESQGDAVPCE